MLEFTVNLRYRSERVFLGDFLLVGKLKNIRSLLVATLFGMSEKPWGHYSKVVFLENLSVILFGVWWSLVIYDDHVDYVFL